MKSEIKFAEAKVEKALQELKDSKTEDKKLYKWIFRAFEDLEENAFCGIRIQKKLIQQIYIENMALIISGNMIYLKAGGLSIQLPMGRYVFFQLFWNGWITRIMRDASIIEAAM